MPFITISIFAGGVLIGHLLSQAYNSVSKKNVLEDEIEGDSMREKAEQSVTERIERRKNRVMEKAVANGKITNDDVEELYCISDRTASSYLNQLVKDKKLQKHGGGRGTYYTPN